MQQKVPFDCAVNLPFSWDMKKPTFLFPFWFPNFASWFLLVLEEREGERLRDFSNDERLNFRIKAWGSAMI